MFNKSDLSYLFSSQAKYKVLSVLASRNNPVHLRDLATLSKLQVRSVQLAVASLKKLGILRTQLDSNRLLISINALHTLSSFLRAFFKEEINREIVLKSEQRTNAASVLKQVDEIISLSRSTRLGNELTWQKSRAI